jgi:hypothetical protein
MSFADIIYDIRCSMVHENENLNVTEVGDCPVRLVLCQSCFDIWYPLGSRSWKTDFAGRLSWRSVIG